MENFDGAFEFGDGPHADAGEVLELWLALVRHDAPWSEMYLDDVSGRWSQVVAELLDGWIDVTPGERRQYLRRAAHRHGEFRRSQGCGSRELAEEVSLLEAAIAEVLHRSGASSTFIERTLRGLAPDLRSIGRAVHAGYVDGP